MRIRIRHITLMWIRILPFALVRIRIRFLLLIKVFKICNHWHADLPRLHFEPPRLHCQRQRPSKAFILSLLSSWNLTSMQIRIHLWSASGSGFTLWCGTKKWCGCIRIRIYNTSGGRPSWVKKDGKQKTKNFTSAFYTLNVRLNTMITELHAIGSLPHAILLPVH